jgi:hypothetical protein
VERWEYRFRSRAPSPVLGRLREHWLRYRRLRRTHEGPDAIGFVGYLQVVLDCDGPGALVRRAFFRHLWRRRVERDTRHRERELNQAGFP